MNYKSKQFRNLLHRITIVEGVDPLERKKKLLAKKRAGIKLTPKEEEELKKLGKISIYSHLSGQKGGKSSFFKRIGKILNTPNKVIGKIK